MMDQSAHLASSLFGERFQDLETDRINRFQVINSDYFLNILSLEVIYMLNYICQGKYDAEFFVCLFSAL